MSGWTQPLCATCWPTWELAQGSTPREPVTLRDPPETACVACGQVQRDGIFVRCDPKAHEPWTAAKQRGSWE